MDIIRSKPTIIEKDGNKILLSDDVVKAHLSAVREYQVSGI